MGYQFQRRFRVSCLDVFQMRRGMTRRTRVVSVRRTLRTISVYQISRAALWPCQGARAAVAPRRAVDLSPPTAPAPLAAGSSPGPPSPSRSPPRSPPSPGSPSSTDDGIPPRQLFQLFFSRPRPLTHIDRYEIDRRRRKREGATQIQTHRERRMPIDRRMDPTPNIENATPRQGTVS